MVRVSIADKSRFQWAADSVMVSSGPSVLDRKLRVERNLLKSLPGVVSSIEEEVLSQETVRIDDDLKKRALEEFKPKSSDTHRSDKKRKVWIES